jgi:hypothetical protein
MAKKKTSKKKALKEEVIQKKELTPDEQHRLERYRQQNKYKPIKLKLRKNSPHDIPGAEPMDPDDPMNHE